MNSETNENSQKNIQNWISKFLDFYNQISHPLSSIVYLNPPFTELPVDVPFANVDKMVMLTPIYMYLSNVAFVL